MNCYDGRPMEHQWFEPQVGRKKARCDGSSDEKNKKVRK